jgi:hypothetical protein
LSLDCGSTLICSSLRHHAAKAKLPKLSKILTNPATRWMKIVMPEWYGGERCTLKIAIGAAIWYHAGLLPVPIRWVLVRNPAGERKPSLCTDLNASPTEILGWFVQRRSRKTTFQETRDHLGVETQRQWSDLAILRTTRALLGLFSLITIWSPTIAAWYAKTELTFSDAIGAVRRVLWCPPNFSMSRKARDIVEIPGALLQRLTETLCCAT